MIIALAVTFTLIAKLESEITLIKRSLNFKCQRFYTLNKVSLNNFEMRIKELSANTSSKLEGLDVNNKVLSLLTHHLLYLINTSSFSSDILSLQEKMNEEIINRFLNLSLAQIRLKKKN